ncbi:MAG: hypothetical protein M3135_05435 [Actinomycetota bacterium]|nr:hypothetical protein [Actinomycetota bacterium]
MRTRTGEEPLTIQNQVEDAKRHRPRRRAPDDDAGSRPTDPGGLLLGLEADGRFHRDRGLGRIYHLRGVSFRESQPTNSLHITVHGNRLAAHVDRVSPLGIREERKPRYSLRRAATHNLAGMAEDLVRLVRGRQGDHRCELNCEWVWDPAESEPDSRDLLDGSASSWSVQLEARVTGSLEAGRLRAAVAAVLGDRAMEEVPLEALDCPDAASLDAARVRLQAHAVPPGKWPPFRACLARHPNGDVLMFNLNHAAADGFGAMRVLDCVADAYASGMEPDPPLDFLATRTIPVRPASAPVSPAMAVYKTLVERLRDRFARPAQLIRDGEVEEPGYGFHLVRLSPAETARVIDVQRPGTSRNRLMAALHLAIGEWNREHGWPGRQIGVLTPVNLRPPEWPEEKIGNFSVTARVSTRRRHRSDPAIALRTVSAQTTRNKRTRTGVALIDALGRIGLLGLWVKQSLVVLQPLTRNRLVDTALLAQLGWFEGAPSFGEDAGQTTEIWFSVPARAPLALCLGTLTVAGCLHLTVRYPRRLLNADAARRFSDCFLANIERVAEAPGEGTC